MLHEPGSNLIISPQSTSGGLSGPVTLKPKRPKHPSQPRKEAVIFDYLRNTDGVEGVLGSCWDVQKQSSGVLRFSFDSPHHWTVSTLGFSVWGFGVGAQGWGFRVCDSSKTLIVEPMEPTKDEKDAYSASCCCASCTGPCRAMSYFRMLPCATKFRLLLCCVALLCCLQHASVYTGWGHRHTTTNNNSSNKNNCSCSYGNSGSSSSDSSNCSSINTNTATNRQC